MTDPTPLPEGDFRMFIQKISMQGLYALGVIDIPGAPKQEPNLQVAGSVIGDLEALLEKTEGNLTAGEEETLKKAISDLKLLHVQVSSGSAS